MGLPVGLGASERGVLGSDVDHGAALGGWFVDGNQEGTASPRTDPGSD